MMQFRIETIFKKTRDCFKLHSADIGVLGNVCADYRNELPICLWFLCIWQFWNMVWDIIWYIRIIWDLGWISPFKMHNHCTYGVFQCNVWQEVHRIVQGLRLLGNGIYSVFSPLHIDHQQIPENNSLSKFQSEEEVYG